VVIIKEIGATIGRIWEIAGAITAAVTQQAATTQEIAEDVHAAASSAGRVNTNIIEVTDSTVGITAASSQVLSSAQTLAQDGNRLSAEMERFLNAVYAA
jgi:methyl-accepting chemotaxis protein